VGETAPYISYEAFLGTADEDVPAAWVDGKVILTGSSSSRHQQILGFLLTLLAVFAEERMSGKVRSRPFQMKTGAALPGREPDLLYVAGANLSRLKERYLNGPADLAVEIISPESRARDRGEILRVQGGAVCRNTGSSTPTGSRRSFTGSTTGHLSAGAVD